MRVVFAGTPAFAGQALEAILAAGHTVPLVLTQPDRPAGRGMRLHASAVKQVAQHAGIDVCQPRSLRLDGRHAQEARAARAALQDARPDVIVVAAYGLILPDWVLTLPPHGCLNIHASLLPRWRGAAPIQRAIEAGDDETGITIMQMDAGLDTGDILLTHALAIRPDHTAARLHDDLAAMGAQAIVEALDQLGGDGLVAHPQPADGVTYAHKLQKSEALLDFSQPARDLERRIRAFQPFPGASVYLPGIKEPVKIWQARAMPVTSALSLETCVSGENANAPAADAVPPGTVLQAGPQGIDIVTGQGALRLLELQRAGGRRQAVDVFVRGWSV